MACVGCDIVFCPSRCPDSIPKIANYYCSICGMEFMTEKYILRMMMENMLIGIVLIVKET